MAPLIKREMDKRYSPTWHVFIGKDFGANVTHENKSAFLAPLPRVRRTIPPADALWRALPGFISFILGPLSFLVFKSG